MAAPTPTNRATPSGVKMDDGYPIKITLAADTDIEFWEKAGTPPGIDGGDAIDTTTMHNASYRTMAPRQLKTATASTFTVAYDPVVYNSILEAINRKDTITVTFPNGDQLAFYGYLKSFTPSDHVEGEQPEATVEIVPTNWDHVNNVEAAPNYVTAAGTDV